MNKNLSLASFFATFLILVALTGCSSDKQEGDGTSGDVAEATADANADASLGDSAAANSDAANTDAANAGDMAAQDPNAAPADGAPADGAVADNQQPPADSGTNGEVPQGDLAQTDPNANPANPGDAPPADTAASTAPTNTDEFNSPGDSSAAAPAPAPAPEVASNNDAGNPPPADQGGDLFGGAAATTGSTDAGAPAEEKPKKSLPLAHLKEKPFKKGGQLLNTAYIARDGDTLDSVSEKLFGENKVKMLKKANPTLKKNLKAGDKIYFNSPNRPDDSDKMMTVYEDQGLPPSTYTSKDGDTLKSLAMEWYGSEGSYKEIYAINRNLSSTKDLPAGTELQYWPASVSIVAYNAKKDVVADNGPTTPEAPAPATANNAPNTPPAPPAPAMGQVAPGQVPPPAAPPAAMNNMPPPPDLNAPPLPPPPSTIRKKGSPTDNMDKDTIMYVVAAGVLLVGGGLIVALRKRNNKRNQGMTQI